MKIQAVPDESMTVACLTALLMEQRAAGDAQGCKTTRRLIALQFEMERRRDQAALRKRWTKGEGANDEQDRAKCDP